MSAGELVPARERGGWKPMLSGAIVDLLDPDPATIDFGDIAHNLARIARFTGATAGTPYSVAQHCVMGSDAIIAETGAPGLGAMFLLHDAHEYVLGDLTTPVAEAVATLTFGARTALAALKRRLDEAIHLAARCPLPTLPEELEAIHDMDLRMLRAERDALMGPQARAWAPAVEAAAPIPSLPPIEPWTHELAELMYRNRLGHYLPHVVARAA